MTSFFDLALLPGIMADTESANEWTIIYHASPIKGRSEFLKLLFEDAGIPYSVSNDNM